jgi:hypothetical protein
MSLIEAASMAEPHPVRWHACTLKGATLRVRGMRNAASAITAQLTVQARLQCCRRGRRAS